MKAYIFVNKNTNKIRQTIASQTDVSLNDYPLLENEEVIDITTDFNFNDTNFYETFNYTTRKRVPSNANNQIATNNMNDDSIAIAEAIADLYSQVVQLQGGIL